jgi:hypothetical protein
MSKEKEKNKEKKSEKKSDNLSIEKTNNEIILKFIDDFSTGIKLGVTKSSSDEESKKEQIDFIDNFVSDFKLKMIVDDLTEIERFANDILIGLTPFITNRKDKEVIFKLVSIEGFTDENESSEESVNQPPIKEEMLTKDSNVVSMGNNEDLKGVVSDKSNEILDFKVPEFKVSEFDGGKMMAIGVKKEQLNPYQIRIKNLTDEKLYDVDLFNYKHDKQNKIEYSCGMGVDYDKFLRILASNRLSEERVDLFRINAWCDYPKFRNKQLNSCLHTIYEEPNGISSSCPTGLGIYFSAYQMQSDIIDVRVDSLKIQLNNLLQLRLSYLMPETEMVFTIFPSKIIE